MYQSFEDLDVWKKACSLAVHVYELLKDVRDYGLRDQMQRAAVSIASNIAEGSERSTKDYCRFLIYAKGSAGELRTQTYIASKVGLLTTADMKEIVSELKDIGRMLQGLINTLQRHEAARG